MKKIALLIMFMICVATTYAQSISDIKASHNTPQSRFVRSMLARNPEQQAAKSTQVYERVVAKSEYSDSSNNFTVIDSTSYIYKAGNNHGSKFDYGYLDYPTDYYYKKGVLNEFFSVNGVNGVHIEPYLSMDTLKYYHDPLSQQYSEISTYAYTPNRDIYEYNYARDDSVDTTQLRIVAQYDALNNINSDIVLQNNVVNSFDTISKAFFYYAQNKLFVDSEYYLSNQVFSPLIVSNYQYDNSGNLIKIIDTNLYSGDHAVYINTYTTNNQLLTSSCIGNIGNTFDSFGYTPGYDNYTYTKHVGGNSSYIQKYHVGASGQIDSVFDYTNGGAMVQDFCVFTYNTYGDPRTLTIFQGSPDNATTYGQERYYYQTYTPPAAVNNISNTIANIIVYPNPANNTLYISGLENIKGAATINLTNSIGQLMMTQSGNAGSMQSITLAGLAAGMYIALVSDATGNELCRQKFIKQ